MNFAVVANTWFARVYLLVTVLLVSPFGWATVPQAGKRNSAPIDSVTIPTTTQGSNPVIDSISLAGSEAPIDSVTVATDGRVPETATAPSRPQPNELDEEPPEPVCTVFIKIVPADISYWRAAALEESIKQQIIGYERVEIADLGKNRFAACDQSEKECLQELARLGVDVVMTGELGNSGLYYQIYETWTPSFVAEAFLSMGVGTDMARLKQKVLAAFSPILEKGGLFEKKVFRDKHQIATQLSQKRTNYESKVLAVTLATLVLVFFLPLAFGVEAYGPKHVSQFFQTRTFSTLTPLCFVLVLLALSFTFDLWALIDSNARWAIALQLSVATLNSPTWLTGVFSGLLWGWFIIVCFRVAFVPVMGMDRIGHLDVMRVIGAWFHVVVKRLFLLFIFFYPFVDVFMWIQDELVVQKQFVLMFCAPALGLLLRYWFLCFVETFSFYLDRKLVEGDASKKNPWHRDIRKYLYGYIKRLGWEIPEEEVDQILFLPGNQPGVHCYGGGLTHPRVVIDRRLLHFAIGAPEEVPAASAFIPWKDWYQGLRLAHSQANPPPIKEGLFKRIGKAQKKLVSRFGKRSSKKTDQTDPGIQRRRPAGGRNLGFAATPLGYVSPFPPGELVPLIADDTEDFGVVRQLLAEHYAWFEGDPDDESDDTDPTDKDFLFGTLVREIGLIQRKDNELATLTWTLHQRAQASWEFVKAAHAKIVSWYERWFSRYPCLLADAYAALNLARNHLIQYLYLVGWKDQELITARADFDKLNQVSKEIFENVKDRQTKDKDIKQSRASIPNRLVWLSQFFESSLQERKRTGLRILTGTAATLLTCGILALLVKQAIDYHPIYEDRMLKMKQELEKEEEESKADKPGEQPATPGAQPTTPGAQPTTPGAQPTTPAVQPATPGSGTTTQGAQPAAEQAKPKTEKTKPTRKRSRRTRKTTKKTKRTKRTKRTNRPRKTTKRSKRSRKTTKRSRRTRRTSKKSKTPTRKRRRNYGKKRQ